VFIIHIVGEPIVAGQKTRQRDGRYARFIDMTMAEDLRRDKTFQEDRQRKKTGTG
jgi:hypothetical protein